MCRLKVPSSEIFTQLQLGWCFFQMAYETLPLRLVRSWTRCLWSLILTPTAWHLWRGKWGFKLRLLNMDLLYKGIVMKYIWASLIYFTNCLCPSQQEEAKELHEDNVLGKRWKALSMHGMMWYPEDNHSFWLVPLQSVLSLGQSVFNLSIHLFLKPCSLTG